MAMWSSRTRVGNFRAEDIWDWSVAHYKTAELDHHTNGRDDRVDGSAQVYNIGQRLGLKQIDHSVTTGISNLM